MSDSPKVVVGGRPDYAGMISHTVSRSRRSLDYFFVNCHIGLEHYFAKSILEGGGGEEGVLPIFYFTA